MKEWVAKRITELLGIEEEVLIGMVHALLEEPEVGWVKQAGKQAYPHAHTAAPGCASLGSGVQPARESAACAGSVRL